MNTGIIGAGGMGTCLASKFAELGHTVSIANSRGPESLKQLAKEVGAKAGTVEEVIINKNVIVVSIPVKNIPDLPKDLFRHLPEDVAVIDTGNYYPNLRDGILPGLEQSGIDSLWVQEQLGVSVVKVFNSVFAESLRDFGKPKGEKNRISLAVSGDNKKAKEVVFDLVDEMGFDPFDIGDIAQSWKQQPGSPIYCRDIGMEEIRKRINDMSSEWTVMREIILSKRTSYEAIMKTDYPAYLRSLKD